MRRLLGLALAALVLVDAAGAAQMIARTGEAVEVTGSRAQEVADLLASFPHGSELAQVNVAVVTPDEAEQRCRGGIACYFPAEETLVMPEAIDGWEWEQVLAHEYGHHLAHHRLNSPWDALDWGPKHWATAEEVCEKDREGLLVGYRRDPGEAFAEAYRLLVAAQAKTWTAFPMIVDDGVFPMAAEIQDAVLRDVEQPWVAPRTWTWARKLRGGTATAVKIATPLDGTFGARLTAGAGVLELSGSATGRRIDSVVCGDRSLRLRVKAAKSGIFRISLTAP